LEGLSEEIR